MTAAGKVTFTGKWKTNTKLRYNKAIDLITVEANIRKLIRKQIRQNVDLHNIWKWQT